MGKLLRRVPLGFEWPLKELWGGYVNSFYDASSECHHCRSTGLSPYAKHLQDKWYGYVHFSPEENGSIPYTHEHPLVRDFAERNVANAPDYYGTGEAAIVAEASRLAHLFNTQWHHHLNADDVAILVNSGRLKSFVHTWSPEAGWQPRQEGVLPTAQDVNAWGFGGLNIGSSDLWEIAKEKCARAGSPHYCEHCAGEGRLWPSQEAKKLYDEWEPTDPPKGEGYQLWENTTEGSPVSPVFTTLSELCAWCADNAYTFAYNKATADEWRQMLDDDFVCHKEGSMIFL